MITAVNSCNWNSWAREKGEEFSLEQMLEDASATGYDAVEIGGGEKRLGAPAQFQGLLDKYNLKHCAYGASITANPYEPNTRQYRQAMREAVEYGQKIVMACGGFLGSPRRNAYPADYDLFAENMRAALDFAHNLGLEIAYHPHRGCLVETISETQKMIDRLPDLKLCIDTAHLEAVFEDSLKFIEIFGDRIIHTHIKDYHRGENQFCELGRGDTRLDLKACVEALKDRGFDGALTVELDCKPKRPPRESCQISMDFLKPLFPRRPEPAA